MAKSDGFVNARFVQMGEFLQVTLGSLGAKDGRHADSKGTKDVTEDSCPSCPLQSCLRITQRHGLAGYDSWCGT
jgi:hypothetical protein